MSDKNMKVLDQDVDDDAGTFRVQVGSAVRHLTIECGVFSESTLQWPDKLVNALHREPQCIPHGEWTDVAISRGRDGAILAETSTYPDDEDEDVVVEHVHPCSVDVLSLATTSVIRSGVSVVKWDTPTGHAVAKIACFRDQLHRIDKETWAYMKIETARQDEKDKNNNIVLAPRLLAQITENGMPIGVLLEKLEGDRAGIVDLAECESVVRQLHGLGIVHGDLNRYNFIVDRRNGDKIVRLIDFEKAKPYNKAAADAELDSLPAKLADESGAGGTFRGPVGH